VSADTFDYYLSFILWTFTLFFSIFFNTLYSYFFLNDFFNKYDNKKIFKNSEINTNIKPIFISKNNLNVLLYSWLTNNSSHKNSKILEAIFDNKINEKWWNNNYNFFIKFYKISYILNLISDKNSAYQLSNNLNFLTNNSSKINDSDFLSYFNNNKFLKNFSNAIFFFSLKQYKNNFDEKNNSSSSLFNLNKRYDWNLYNLSNETSNYNFLLKNVDGFFILNNLNYEKYSYLFFNFQELFLLNNFFKNQLNSAKWNRWLYKYSLLHRKILKNSHKITLVKRLINNGFYDSKLYNSNIWAVNYLSKNVSNDSFNSFFNIFYGNLLNNSNRVEFLNKNSNFSNNNDQKTNLNLLNFYENSYFWYLKRFYNFNTLSTNLIKSKVTFNYNDSNDSEIFNNNKNLINLKSTFSSYILNSFYLNNKLISNTYTYNDFYENKTPSASNEIFKDYFISINNSSIINKNNLNVLYWLTSSLNEGTNLAFYNYIAYKNFLNLNSEFSNISFNQNEVNYWIAYTLLNSDKTYLNDFIYINLFY